MIHFYNLQKKDGRFQLSGAALFDQWGKRKNFRYFWFFFWFVSRDTDLNEQSVT